MSEQKQLRVTTIEELKEYNKGTIVELPPFGDGQPFVARLRRPSMLGLIKGGKIPNSLVVKANEMFADSRNALDTEDENMMSQMFDVIDTIAEASFIEPKYQDIKDAGITLTDDQMMFIFTYSQQGVKALESFRN